MNFQLCRERHPGLHRLLTDHEHVPCERHSEFVNVVGLILGQRVRFSYARKLRAAVREILGTNYTAEDIRAHEPELRAVLPANKADCVMGYANGSSFGVGPWTVKCAKLMEDPSAQQCDCILWEDLMVRRQLEECSDFAGKSRKEIDRELEIYAPHRGIISYNLWRRSVPRK